MSWFNRYVIGAMSPTWALKRERHARGLQAFYEATEPTRFRKQRSGSSANSANDRSATKLVNMARHLEENFDIASGALDVLVANTVGSGIQPEPLVENKTGEMAVDFNEGLIKLYEDWIKSPEVTRQHDYYSLQRIVARSWFRDGEVFGQRLVGKNGGLDHNTVVPYSIYAFESDYLPFDSDATKGLRQGMKVDKFGRPTSYHFYANHPGDRSGTHLAFGSDTREVRAENVMHLKMVKRLHQLRGVTLFAPVLARFDDIKEIDESERIAARVASAMAAFIKKGLPEDYTTPQTTSDGQVQLREMEFIPGIIFDDLQPGEDVGTIASNRPNNALIPFRDSQLRAGAAGLMCSYSSLSKNYNGTYSAQRQELVEQFAVYRGLSSHIVFRFAQPTWEGFVNSVVMSGALQLRDVDMSTIYNATHTAPPMPWIDPKKELEAAVLAEEHLYESKGSIIRRRGQRPDQVFREIERDRSQLERRGLDNQAAADPAPPPSDDPGEETNLARPSFTFQQRRAR